MNSPDNYQHITNASGDYWNFFSETPLKDWTYSAFRQYYPGPSNKKSLSIYRYRLELIKNSKVTPQPVMDKIDSILKKDDTSLLDAAVGTTININQGSSLSFASVINYGHSTTISTPGSSTATAQQNDLHSKSNLKRPFEQTNESNGLNDFFEGAMSTLEAAMSPAEFRKTIYAYGTKALTKESLSLNDVRILNMMVSSFKPTTLGQQLDAMAGKLSSSITLNNIVDVQALKMCLSRTIDLVNSKVTNIFKKHIDHHSWEKVVTLNRTLDAGMYDSSKQLYHDMVTKATDGNNKINQKKLRIAITRAKLLALESDNTTQQQLFDIMDTVAKYCLSDPASVHPKKDSELTCYRKFTKVLDDIMNDTMLDILDGETTCKASKKIAKDHKKLYKSTIPLNAGFGRRIDMILTTKNVELSTSEWKRPGTISTKCLQQQSKNIRMNKAVLSHLLALPFDLEDVDKVFTVGMDWTGPRGYMFAVNRLDDVYVARTLHTLLFPSYLDDLPAFVTTLDHLYAWRNHHQKLKDIVLPALRKHEDNQHFAELFGSLPATTTTTTTDINSCISPNIYLTPTQSQKRQTVTFAGLDGDDDDDDDYDDEGDD
ncbi:hypothetical protein BC941DRAFT_482354 [Chlamydoabsidia padenii]|nr:hypothetical protein BC941DRAFT_482354 [Chlamydoabsidia padenii]